MKIKDLTNFEELTVPEASKVIGGAANYISCPIPDPPPPPPRPVVPSRGPVFPKLPRF